ncbi:MAG TPA: ribonuclease HI [Candidatus Coprenecus merdipullorum]|nr:ribonuclease HI [Candidatus Coprenecus merdipullorum]
MSAERKLLPIEIFTDGSSRGNPGPGGYGVILRCGEHYKELSEGFAQTTNNRMELTAVIVGLEAVKRPDAEIILYSDSRYVVDSVNKGWVFNWERKNFEKRLNADLWIRFLNVYRRHRVRLVWVKGHADNPMNNRCDQLAVAAALKVAGT